jgi:hypothetical protein
VTAPEGEQVDLCTALLRSVRAARASATPAHATTDTPATVDPGIDAETYTAATGRPPQDDDLDRANCPKTGDLGHLACGWDTTRNIPRAVAMTTNVRDARTAVIDGTTLRLLNRAGTVVAAATLTIPPGHAPYAAAGLTLIDRGLAREGAWGPTAASTADSRPALIADIYPVETP